MHRLRNNKAVDPVHLGGVVNIPAEQCSSVLFLCPTFLMRCTVPLGRWWIKLQASISRLHWMQCNYLALMPRRLCLSLVPKNSTEICVQGWETQRFVHTPLSPPFHIKVRRVPAAFFFFPLCYKANKTLKVQTKLYNTETAPEMP